MTATDRRSRGRADPLTAKVIGVMCLVLGRRCDCAWRPRLIYRVPAPDARSTWTQHGALHTGNRLLGWNRRISAYRRGSGHHRLEVPAHCSSSSPF